MTAEMILVLLIFELILLIVLRFSIGIILGMIIGIITERYILPKLWKKRRS